LAINFTPAVWTMLRAPGLAAAFLWLAVPLAIAGSRVALVIGNAACQNSTPLANPINDARAIAAKLKLIGFGVLRRPRDKDERAELSDPD